MKTIHGASRYSLPFAILSRLPSWFETFFAAPTDSIPQPVQATVFYAMAFLGIKQEDKLL
jgi:hypothetical protein